MSVSYPRLRGRARRAVRRGPGRRARRLVSAHHAAELGETAGDGREVDFLQDSVERLAALFPEVDDQVVDAHSDHFALEGVFHGAEGGVQLLREGGVRQR